MSQHHTRRALTRRTVLRDLGGSVLGLAVVGLAAACDDGQPAGGSGSPSPATAGGRASPGRSPGSTGEVVGGWHRVELEFVSAYVLARGDHAAVVDTGTQGSAADVEAVLTAAGLGWGDVGHVILTHRHPDHVGSLPAVLEAATAATAYAGAADIEAIAAPRELTAVGDGDTVFDLDVVATPGHTPGHISVLDPAGSGVLLAGDALTADQEGHVAGPDPEFTEDLPQANASVRRLGELTFDAALVGHGTPVLGDAAAQVRQLGREL